MVSIIKKNPWIVRAKPNPEASCRLFCFPYAGGGASIYRTWHEELPDHVEVCAIQLPGRETRFGDDPIGSIQTLITTLAPLLVDDMDRPFYFFGHSMGALIAFELSHLLREKGLRLPECLILSGRGAPGNREKQPILHNLPDNLFIEALERFNGTPAAVLANRELMEIMIPILRADFSIIETHQYRQKPPLDIPFIVFGGRGDEQTPPTTLPDWEKETASEFSLTIMEGDHFFLHSRRGQLLNRISSRITPHGDRSWIETKTLHSQEVSIGLQKR